MGKAKNARKAIISFFKSRSRRKHAANDDKLENRADNVEDKTVTITVEEVTTVESNNSSVAEEIQVNSVQVTGKSGTGLTSGDLEDNCCVKCLKLPLDFLTGCVLVLCFPCVTALFFSGCCGLSFWEVFRDTCYCCCCCDGNPVSCCKHCCSDCITTTSTESYESGPQDTLAAYHSA